MNVKYTSCACQASECTDEAHCCRGRPLLRRADQSLRIPFSLKSKRFTNELESYVAILLCSFFWLERSICDSGFAEAFCTTLATLTLEMYADGMPKIRLRLLQWKASNLSLSFFKSHSESSEYNSLLSTQEEYI